jgi:hypothetical protein
MALVARLQKIKDIMGVRRIYQFTLPPNNTPTVAALIAALAVPPLPEQNNDALTAALIAIKPKQPQNLRNDDALLSAILAAMAKKPEREEEKDEEEEKEKEKEEDEEAKEFNKQIDCLGESENIDKIGCINNNR